MFLKDFFRRFVKSQNYVVKAEGVGENFYKYFQFFEVGSIRLCLYILYSQRKFIIARLLWLGDDD